jgi:mannose-6-phosphate isomerase-like protein (cupin superfamily)
MSFHYRGHGEHKLKAGDCHIIPAGLSHTVTSTPAGTSSRRVSSTCIRTPG